MYQHWQLPDCRVKPTLNHSNADELSRLPLQVQEEDDKEQSVLSVSQLETLPVTADQVRNATHYDPVISKVLDYVLKGWPGTIHEILQPFYTC